MGCIKSKQGLSQEDLEFLKAHTRYDENTIKEWYKGFKQDCPNGRLTPVKFVDMYKMFFPSGNAEQFCDHVFRQVHGHGRPEQILFVRGLKGMLIRAKHETDMDLS